jgi:hypothetical protein
LEKGWSLGWFHPLADARQLFFFIFEKEFEKSLE